MKKLAALWLSLLVALGALTGCGQEVSIGVIGSADGPTQIVVSDGKSDSAQAEATPEEADALDADGAYDTPHEVARYLEEYGHLPSNYITKKQAQSLGWEGGSLEPYAPGCTIGGDRFGNYEGVLPDGNYHECDLGTIGADKRGAERLIWSDDGRYYYTADHYKTFTEITGEIQDAGASS